MIDFIVGLFPGIHPTLVAALDVTAKAMVLLFLAYSIHFGLGRRRVLARSALWSALLATLIWLPLVELSLPRLPFAVLPSAPASSTAKSAQLSFPQSAVLLEEKSVTNDKPGITVDADQNLRPKNADGAAADDPIVVPRRGGAAILISSYLSVASILAVRLGGSLAAARRLTRRSRPVDHSDWERSFEDTRVELGIPSRRAARIGWCRCTPHRRLAEARDHFASNDGRDGRAGDDLDGIAA